MDSEALARWSREEVAFDLADALFMTTNADSEGGDVLSYIPEPPAGASLRLWLRSSQTGERRLFHLAVTELPCSPKPLTDKTPTTR